MADGRPLVWSTVLIIVLSAALSGPLVGAAVDLTTEPPPSEPRPGTGSATVDVRSVPPSVTLQRSAFGAGTFHLESFPATVRVRSVTGNPLLRYSIDIPGLWFTDSKRYRLHGRAGGRVLAEAVSFGNPLRSLL